MDPIELQYKAWEKTVDVQMHFNDLCLRLRSYAISILGVLLGATALAYRYGGTIEFFKIKLHTSAVFIFFCNYCLASFFSNG